MDRWGDVKCPSCGQKKVHAWYFDSDCRGNPSSEGAEDCKSCGYKLSEKEQQECVHKLWEH